MAAGSCIPAPAGLQTVVLPVDLAVLCVNSLSSSLNSFNMDNWTPQLRGDSQDARYLHRAARELRTTDIPVAFPTETVYGLGADATRSSAVQGIYKAKQRPSDNPLIVHVHSLQQLRSLLRPPSKTIEKYAASDQGVARLNGTDGINFSSTPDEDPIPQIYLPLIRKFWPGPLTMIMPNPENSPLAPEVTAGLKTFGVRMPKNMLALALIKLADVPLAAPSANASTRPSPTTAEHVKHDLEGRITTIIDGGPCEVGVESTVVDGLSDPPVVLRPGGISIEQLRTCPGWENVGAGYKDKSETDLQPRAPGMKYRHYSPKATVILYECTTAKPTAEDFSKYVGRNRRIGVIRTRRWPSACGLKVVDPAIDSMSRNGMSTATNGSARLAGALLAPPNIRIHWSCVQLDSFPEVIDLWEVNLGSAAEGIAQGLFSALRELDQKQVDVIFVEGIEDREGDIAAAVMNRLRKAAEVEING